LGRLISRSRLRHLGLGLGHQRAQTLELGVVAARLGGADFLGGGILRGLRRLGGEDLGPARLVQRQHLRRQPRQAPPRQGGIEGCGVFADRADVVHDVTLSFVWPRPCGNLVAAARGAPHMPYRHGVLNREMRAGALVNAGVHS
jgi:hypothetical protein